MQEELSTALGGVVKASPAAPAPKGKAKAKAKAEPKAKAKRKTMGKVKAGLV